MKGKSIKFVCIFLFSTFDFLFLTYFIMNKRFATIFVVFGIVFFILGALLYYRNYFKTCCAPDVIGDVSVVEEITPGVTIVQGEEGRILRNERDGYEVEVGDGLEVVYVDKKTISIGEKNKSLETSHEGYEIIVYDKKIDDINFWLNNWISESNCPECYVNIEKKGDYYRLEDIGGMGTIINYFFINGGKIFQITLFDPNLIIEDLLGKINFSLL